VAGSNPAVPASRHRALALATMPHDRLRAILCRRRWTDVLDQGVHPAGDSDLPGPQSAQLLDRQARREFNAPPTPERSYLMANVRRHMGIKYNLSTCTDNHLRNLEMHIAAQMADAERFLEAVQAEIAERLRLQVNDSTTSKERNPQLTSLGV
jgi:hypothetical protein